MKILSAHLDIGVVSNNQSCEMYEEKKNESSGNMLHQKPKKNLNKNQTKRITWRSGGDGGVKRNAKNTTSVSKKTRSPYLRGRECNRPWLRVAGQQNRFLQGTDCTPKPRADPSIRQGRSPHSCCALDLGIPRNVSTCESKDFVIQGST